MMLCLCRVGSVKNEPTEPTEPYGPRVVGGGGGIEHRAKQLRLAGWATIEMVAKSKNLPLQWWQSTPTDPRHRIGQTRQPSTTQSPPPPEPKIELTYKFLYKIFLKLYIHKDNLLLKCSLTNCYLNFYEHWWDSIVGNFATRRNFVVILYFVQNFREKVMWPYEFWKSSGETWK